MVFTQLLLIFTLATVAIGQERVCSYTDQEYTSSFDSVDARSTADTLADCQKACDGDPQCEALTYTAQGGTGVDCYLYYNVPSTQPALFYTYSTKQTCVDVGNAQECTYTDQEDILPQSVADEDRYNANTLPECKTACDLEERCAALVYSARNGTGQYCGLFFSVPDTGPAYVYTVSTQQACSGDEPTDPCDSAQCQNGATCLGDPDNATFTCVCPFGFAGDSCAEECDFTCPSVKTCRHGSFQLVDRGDGNCPSFACEEKDKPGNGFGRFKGLRRFLRHRWLHG